MHTYRPRHRYRYKTSIADPVHFFGYGSADPVHFFGSWSADPVFKIRIRIRVTPKRPDPTGSGFYLDMFLMFFEINKFLLHFYTKSKHFLTLKIKDYKLFWRNCILDNFIQRENKNYRGLFVDKGSRSGRPDPQHCTKLIYKIGWHQGLALYIVL